MTRPIPQVPPASALPTALTVVPVDDPADPRVTDYLALTDVALRRRREPAEGLFIAEGERVIYRALRAGYQPRSVLVSPNRLDAVPTEIGSDVPVYLAGPEIMAQITGFEVHRGALAAMARHPDRDPAELLSWALRVLVLEDLVSHTNLGAIFRSAAGLGMDAILLSPRCADPLYRRSVRVSMGEVFAVPYARLDPWPASLAALTDRGFEALALTPAADATDLAALRPAPDARIAVLLGTEGEGLSVAAQAAATRRVRIPMAAGVDSLNVAATAAIACYALGRPPSPPIG
ncbi:RNA methyltransferase [Frankia sp. CNm7]|uniref:RNA methyltransferase n=1 Tax=Frankia nepalensis TaxID=1836974 RepID=A0A937RQ64_9ACTN|nr:RNA methyltransferase [Frankia nepalensis]MBL7495519.1 RNA methyltransferase [Frankia nepalensis]MBL7509800.1 RNA methyltransferase [Frankia nepalensis]MBL7518613.1 RNA methyltransferase [Frankia nepalensis]MBL7630623.1 RNA methyltransferase [Frankia nepalensis]